MCEILDIFLEDFRWSRNRRVRRKENKNRQRWWRNHDLTVCGFVPPCLISMHQPKCIRIKWCSRELRFEHVRLDVSPVDWSEDLSSSLGVTFAPVFFFFSCYEFLMLLQNERTVILFFLAAIGCLFWWGLVSAFGTCNVINWKPPLNLLHSWPV